MRVRLRGINSQRKMLADGTVRTYYWAWKGGPPLRGEPGTPEFIATYNEAAARKVLPPRGTLLSVLQGYQASEDFLGLAPRSRSDYVGKIKLIEKAFGDFPLSAMTDNRTRGIFMEWRDGWRCVAAASRLRLDGARPRALMGHGSRLVAANPCERGGRLYRGTRVDKVWTRRRRGRLPRTCARAPASAAVAGAVDRAAARRSPAACRGRPMTAGTSACGNRRPAPAWSSRSARRSRPRSTRRRSTARSSSPSTDGKPWTPDGFRASWGKACKKAGDRGRHVQRSARHRRHPARAGRVHRSRRSPPSPGTACADVRVDPRRPLSAPRSRAWRGRRSRSSKWATQSEPETKTSERGFQNGPQNDQPSLTMRMRKAY